MQAPNIRSSIYDGASKVRYDVIAYRALTQGELRHAVRMYWSQPRVACRKRQLRNATITILTLHGLSPGF